MMISLTFKVGPMRAALACCRFSQEDDHAGFQDILRPLVVGDDTSTLFAQDFSVCLILSYSQFTRKARKD